ncbi:hypothetical protein MVEN_01459200 [Mycena venus]|uniref:Uncharacterized protein n=1 Tax=Mycena venus TaxID=2733690 RepID=A0A8H6XUN6_9AGAR|nr:hypothetical protein MVEN_01459200 [Mycena venus]
MDLQDRHGFASRSKFAQQQAKALVEPQGGSIYMWHMERWQDENHGASVVAIPFLRGTEGHRPSLSPGPVAPATRRLPVPRHGPRSVYLRRTLLDLNGRMRKKRVRRDRRRGVASSESTVVLRSARNTGIRVASRTDVLSRLPTPVPAPARHGALSLEDRRRSLFIAKHSRARSLHWVSARIRHSLPSSANLPPPLHPRPPTSILILPLTVRQYLRPIPSSSRAETLLSIFRISLDLSPALRPRLSISGRFLCPPSSSVIHPLAPAPPRPPSLVLSVPTVPTVQYGPTAALSYSTGSRT